MYASFHKKKSLIKIEKGEFLRQALSLAGVAVQMRRGLRYGDLQNLIGILLLIDIHEYHLLITDYLRPHINLLQLRLHLVCLNARNGPHGRCNRGELRNALA